MRQLGAASVFFTGNPASPTGSPAVLAIARYFMDTSRMEKLLRMMGSASDGEAVSALRALQRELGKQGCSWHGWIDGLLSYIFQSNLPPSGPPMPEGGCRQAQQGRYSRTSSFSHVTPGSPWGAGISAYKRKQELDKLRALYRADTVLNGGCHFDSSFKRGTQGRSAGSTQGKKAQ